MTPEQELCWKILSWNSAIYAHKIGKELTALLSQCKTKKEMAGFYTRLDELMYESINCESSSESLTRLVATLSITYKLPLYPGKMQSFNQIHTRCHDIIVNNNRYGGVGPIMPYPEPKGVPA